MKVIDLLNKIANGEEVPDKIQVYSDIFVLDYGNQVYEHEKTGTNLLSIYNGNILNYEVRIIEEKEETKPITKESIEALGYACGEIQKCFTNGWNKSLKNEPLIEEDKKIEKIYHCCMSTENKETQFLIQNINDLSDKINEIIDYIKGSDKE